jgi:hypothetical protein
LPFNATYCTFSSISPSIYAQPTFSWNPHLALLSKTKRRWQGQAHVNWAAGRPQSLQCLSWGSQTIIWCGERGGEKSIVEPWRVLLWLHKFLIIHWCERGAPPLSAAAATSTETHAVLLCFSSAAPAGGQKHPPPRPPRSPNHGSAALPLGEPL